MKRLIIVAALTMVGCASTDAITTPDGKRGYVVRCNWDWETTANCYEKARKACGGDFTVISRDEHGVQMDVACTT